MFRKPDYCLRKTKKGNNEVREFCVANSLHGQAESGTDMHRW